MGLSADVPVPARYRDAAAVGDDRASAAAPRPRRRTRSGLSAGLIALLLTAPAGAQTVRLATYDSGLGRKGPAVMLRDLRSGKDEQAEAALAVIAAADADVILLQDIDWDVDGLGLAALRERTGYDYALALRPNSGIPSGVDLDGDGRAHEARDALGYGWFTGDSGLAILSRFPLGEARDLSGVLWADRSEAAEVLTPEARAVVPLATTAQWVVPLTFGERTVTLVTMAAGTPVFDGPEDRNGLRNRDELAMVAELAGEVPLPVVLGRGNIDVERGEGFRDAMRALLADPALQDPVPRDASGAAETAIWDDPFPMRVDYVLPSRDLRVVGAGILSPAEDDPLHEAVALAGTGRLVWVDVSLP